MVLGSTEKSLCNKLGSDYNKLVSPLKNVKGQFRKYKTQIDSMLRSMNWSGSEIINNAINQVQSQVNDITPNPDLSELDKFKNFINNCEYLSQLNPLTTITSTADSVFDNIDGILANMKDSVPEFGVANLINTINKLLDGAGIPGGDMLSDLFKTADKLINCLSSGCAAFDPTYIGTLSTISSDLQDLYNVMNIVDDPLNSNYGKFDLDKIYTDVGLTISQKNQMDALCTNVSNIKQQTSEKINNAIGSIKTLQKTGGFF